MNPCSIILSIIDSQEHNWLTGSIIGSWKHMLCNLCNGMELTYIGCGESTCVVVEWLSGGSCHGWDGSSGLVPLTQLICGYHTHQSTTCSFLIMAASENEQHSVSSSQPNESSQDSHVIPSLLSRLKAPTASDLARKRAISKNPTQIAKRSKAVVLEEPNISPAVRVRQFSNDNLSV